MTTHDPVKPIRLVAFVLLLAIGGLTIAACRGEASQTGNGGDNLYHLCRSEGCAM